MFREARRDDLETVLRLYAQLNPEDPPLSDADAVAAFEQILGTPGLHVLLLEEEGVVVATTYLKIIPNLTRAAMPYAVIENVVVEESRRGTGIGKQVMAETLRTAWESGCYKAMLQTGSRRPSTHGFYRACGFTPDEKTGYVAHPPGWSPPS